MKANLLAWILLFSVFRMALAQQTNLSSSVKNGGSFAEIKIKAEKGNVDAQMQLGNCYKFGIEGVAQNNTESRKWYSKALEKIRQAAEHGDAHSQNLLGEAYQLGEGVEPDDKEAFNWFSKAAKQGNADGQRNIALAYRDGTGVAKDDVEAVKWLRKPAKQGDIEAQFNLGLMYEIGRGVPQDPNAAMSWFQKSKVWPFSQQIIEAYNGDIKEQSRLGYYFFNGLVYPEDHAEAAKWYRKAAEQGDRKSQVRLAGMYEDGDGVPKNLSEVAKWYRMAAEQGSALAQAKLGWMYLGANSVETNYSEAYKWFNKAAEQGDHSGLAGLSLCYEAGLGVPVDNAKAVEITRRLAEAGESAEQRNLGLDYERGEGVPQDFVEAYKWYNLAAANEGVGMFPKGPHLYSQELEPASKMRDRLALQMTPEQVVEAQQLSRDFRPNKTHRNSNPSQPNSGSSTTHDETATCGTGFFITDDGYLITNYHVIKGATKVSLLTSGGMIPAKVVQVDAAKDIALLKADGKFLPLPISSSGTAQLGKTVATIGFPDPTLQGFSPKLAKGEIASLSGALDDASYFQISVPVQPGNSGGALVDERGNVIGIVSAKLDASVALAASGALPENVNYAVKSSLLLSFLESVPDVANKLKAPNTADEKFEDVVKSAQDAAVLVLVY